MTSPKFVYDYPRPNVTVDNIIVRAIKNIWSYSRLEILLVKRRNDPYKGDWALPGGYLEMGETLAEAASRELREETGLEAEPEFFSFADAVNRDPRGRTITAVFTQQVPYQTEAVAADDAEEVGWFKLVDIVDGKTKLAFDHNEIVNSYAFACWTPIKAA